MVERKTFDLRTVREIKRAESYKRRLENKYDRVIVVPIGLDRISIEGRKRTDVR